VPAPVPVSVTADPAQTAVEVDAIIPMEGTGFTVTVMVCDAVQVLAAVPVTVYVAVEEGTKAMPLVIPPDHIYVFAPVPFRVTDVPAQTVSEGNAVAPTGGSDAAVTTMDVVPVHPFALVPVTV